MPSIKSDHSLLSLEISLADEPKRGKGTWKLNVSLLEDKEYIEAMRSALNYAIKDAENLKDPSLSWDFIKCIFYCIKTYLHNPNKCLRDLPFGQGHRQCVSPFFSTESTHVNPSGHLLEVIYSL